MALHDKDEYADVVRISVSDCGCHLSVSCSSITEWEMTIEELQVFGNFLLAQAEAFKELVE